MVTKRKKTGRALARAGQDALVLSVIDFYQVWTTGVLDLLDKTLERRRRVRSQVTARWKRLSQAERADAFDRALRQADARIVHHVASHLAKRKRQRGPKHVTFQSEVTFGLGKQDVGSGQTAYGGKVTVRDKRGPILEVGAGVIPEFPGSEVLDSDDPIGEVVRPDRIKGGGAWVKLSY